MMLSESQERMVVVVPRGREEEVAQVFRKWGLEVATIGEVTATGRAEIRFHGEIVADMPIAPLTDDAPVYERPVGAAGRPRGAPGGARSPGAEGILGDTLQALLATPELASKEWIWRQYDHTVRTNTVPGPGGDAAVLLLKGTPAGLGLTSDVNPVYCWLDPRTRRRAGGGRGGAQPRLRRRRAGRAHRLPQLRQSRSPRGDRGSSARRVRGHGRGLPRARRAGHLRQRQLYNETEGRTILPTPTVAMVGVIPNLGNVPDAGFTRAGDRIVLLGEDRGEFGGSAYLRLLFDIEQGLPPRVDLAAEARLARLLRLPRARKAWSTPRTTSPRAVSRWRSPRPVSRAASAPV